MATHGFVLDPECQAMPAGNRGIGMLLPDSSAEISEAMRPNEGLDGPHLAVLSACETGTGMVLNGEGVFGVWRAFAMASVHTLVTSLWALQDEGARACMTAFYQALLSGRWNAQRAAERASLEILRARRAGGREPHHLYWAAFVAAP